LGSLETTDLLLAVLAIAIAAAACRFIAPTIARRNKRRARAYFLLGFGCGLLAGAVARRAPHRVNAWLRIARRLVATRTAVFEALPLALGSRPAPGYISRCLGR
jgi:hypothetical protein